jgi:hypothetical protein
MMRSMHFPTDTAVRLIDRSAGVLRVIRFTGRMLYLVSSTEIAGWECQQDTNLHLTLIGLVTALIFITACLFPAT